MHYTKSIIFTRRRWPSFGGHAPRLINQVPIGFRGTDHNLRDSIPVTQVDEDSATMVAFAFDPSTEGHFSSNVGFAELAAGVGA